jgi:hypothetical protein
VSTWPAKGITDALSLFVGNNGAITKATEQYLPSPPQGFIGHEVDMYLLLNEVLRRRMMSLVAEQGMGASSLASGAWHYINDRKRTIIQI